MIAYTIDILFLTALGMSWTALFFIAVVHIGKREQRKVRNRLFITVNQGDPKKS